MVLVRNVLQVKFGHMDKVLAGVKAAVQANPDAGRVTRVLTDISGPNFTLVLESTASSIDAYWEEMKARFAAEERDPSAELFGQYIESGHREFYTIEYDKGG